MFLKMFYDYVVRSYFMVGIDVYLNQYKLKKNGGRGRVIERFYLVILDISRQVDEFMKGEQGSDWKI